MSPQLRFLDAQIINIIPVDDVSLPQNLIKSGCVIAVTEGPGASATHRPARGGAPVHAGAAAVKQDWTADTRADRMLDRPAGRWRQQAQHELSALAAHAQDPVAVLFTKVGDVAAGGSEDPQAEHGDQHEVVLVRGCQAAVSRASDCRWVNLRVGDSAATAGRRTCSAGECPRDAVHDAVRWKPAATGNRRDTVKGLNPRTSCIHRMYGFR